MLTDHLHIRFDVSKKSKSLKDQRPQPLERHLKVSGDIVFIFYRGLHPNWDDLFGIGSNKIRAITEAANERRKADE
jgi:hypothetical protein